MSISSVDRMAPEKRIACMIDLETLGLEKGSMILSAAAVFFDLNKPVFEHEYIIYSKFDLSRSPGEIDKRTLQWHFNNTPLETIKENFSGAEFIGQFLKHLAEQCRRSTYLTVWSKGVDFDVAMLEHWYSACGIEIPWNYRQRMCYRTIRSVCGDVAGLNPELEEIEEHLRKEKHTAQADALNQAKCLHAIYQRLIFALDIGY